MVNMSSLVVYADSTSFKKEVIDSDVPVLVDFWAEWCGPCRMLLPTIDKLAEGFNGKAKVVKVNTDEASEVASLYQISAIPTVILFNKGKVVNQFVGVQPYETYATEINKNL
jgi:thioredoxin 1